MARRSVFLILLPALAQCQTTAGPPKLDFGAELNRDGTELRIRWSNKSAAPFLVTIGSIIGSWGLDPRVKIFVIGPGLPAANLTDTSQPGIISGRVEPLVVCLTRGAGYSIDLSTDKLWLSDFKRTLQDVRDRHWTLTVTYTGVKALHTSPAGKRIPFHVLDDYPADFPFWTGDINAQFVNR